jgi:hypothetical protein
MRPSEVVILLMAAFRFRLSTLVVLCLLLASLVSVGRLRVRMIRQTWASISGIPTQAPLAAHGRLRAASIRPPWGELRSGQSVSRIRQRHRSVVLERRYIHPASGRCSIASLVVAIAYMLGYSRHGLLRNQCTSIGLQHNGHVRHLTHPYREAYTVPWLLGLGSGPLARSCCI